MNIPKCDKQGALIDDRFGKDEFAFHMQFRCIKED